MKNALPNKTLSFVFFSEKMHLSTLRSLLVKPVHPGMAQKGVWKTCCPIFHPTETQCRQICNKQPEMHSWGLQKRFLCRLHCLLKRVWVEWINNVILLWNFWSFYSVKYWFPPSLTEKIDTISIFFAAFQWNFIGSQASHVVLKRSQCACY